jgi:hypothetical protein
MHEFRGKVRSFATVHELIKRERMPLGYGGSGDDVEDWLSCIRFAFLSVDQVFGGT